MIAFLFPGQGSQRSGMLHAIEALPGAAALIDRASGALNCDLRADDASYHRTVTAQRALFISGVASAGALATVGVMPDAVAGHSVGAIAAAHVAGAMDFETALAIVDRRGTLMANVFNNDYAMGVICGLPWRELEAMVDGVNRSGHAVYASNVNAVDQIAISGTRTGVAHALEAAERAGVRTANFLDVVVPSHSPFMRPVAVALKASFPGIVLRDARCPYAVNATGRIVTSGSIIRDDVFGSLGVPVRWMDATEALFERGVRGFIEMCPGTVLSDLAGSAFPEARSVALETTTIDSVRALTRRIAKGDSVQ